VYLDSKKKYNLKKRLDFGGKFKDLFGLIREQMDRGVVGLECEFWYSVKVCFFCKKNESKPGSLDSFVFLSKFYI
jgi:hypothetical protein